MRRLIDAALDVAADLVAICNADGRLVFLNPAARGLAVGDRVADVLDPDVWGEWFDAHDRSVPAAEWPLWRVLRGEERVEIEGYRRNEDGSRFWMLLSAVAIRDVDGRLLGAMATCKDITAHKLADAATQARNEDLARRAGARTAAFESLQRELAREVRDRIDAADLLERSRRLLQAILDGTTAVIYVKDTSFRYLLVNAQFERIFDLTNAYVAGRSDYELFPRELADPVRANDEYVLATGAPLYCEEEVPQHDGLIHTYVSLKIPLRGEDGTLFGMCGISTDITQRKAMEAELRSSRATLSAVIESSADAIFLVDRQSGLVVANAVAERLFAELDGISPPSPPPAFPAVLGDRWRALIARSLDGEHLSLEESLAVAGRRRIFLLSLNPIREGGLVSGAAVFAKDITELRHAEEQASRHQAELAHLLRLHTVGEMAASLAHEINQPLGAIANYAQGSRRRLEAGTISPKDLSSTMDDIARQALRAGEITRWVRALIRKDQPQREVADISQIITAALAIAAPSAQDRGVAIRFRQDGNLPAVQVDRIQIEQVVLNLVLNALDAVEGERRREIEVSASPCGEGIVEVAVADSGAGIDADVLSRVFEPFFTTKERGLGMGLAISRAIVEAHDGRMSAVRRPQGGSIVSFRLPAGRL